MRLSDGEVACVIGPNGSGKSTILKAIMGIVKPTEGDIMFDGKDITGLEPHEVLRRGICLLPQGRTAFPMMSVLENLEMGAHILKSRNRVQERLREAYDLFPMLKERRKDAASKLSGGELTMLCIARATMSDPKIMLLDEPSLGLAPRVLSQVYEKIVEINSKGSSMVIVEQNVSKVLKIANYAYVLSSGRKDFEGSCEALLKDDRLKKVYLGAVRDESKNRRQD